MLDTPVTRVLDAAGIPYRVFRHPNPVRSLEQAARERGQRPDQVVRSILFRLSEDEFVMVLVAGGRQISWSALRSYLGQNRMTMASEAEVLEVTGYPIGGVSPLGLPAPLRTLVDQSVVQEEEVSLGSGVRGTTIILKSEDLMRALGEVEVGNYIKG
jgi:Cys-tRNA(Pro) deacylase